MFSYKLRTLLILLASALAGCADQQDVGVFVTSAKFGLVQPDGSIVETTRISGEPGTRYGWSLEVTPTTRTTRIKEVFTLPPGEKFGPKPQSEPDAIRVVEHSVSDDGRIQTELFEVISRRSFTVVENYSVSGDDSGGHCVIELYVNEIHVSTFDFDVE
jgi:hypothetical protein